MLEQCAPVRFVEGSNSTAGPSCTNGTGFSAEWTSASSTTGDDEANSTSSSEATTSTPAGAGAALKAGVGSVLGAGLLAAALAL